MTISRDQEGILDSNSPAAGKVHPGLNGDRCFGHKPTFGARTNHRRLVDIEPGAMAQPVSEEFPEARLTDDVSSAGIQIGQGDAWAHGLPCCSRRCINQ